jgi:predicted CoA-binding protein
MAEITDTIRRIAEESQTWAVVGCSPDPSRASHGVAQFLMTRGYRVIPVNPQAGCEEILGQRCYPDLASIPEAVDVVDIFRRSEQAGVHVDEAIAIGARAVWMQLGVIDQAAAARASEAGLFVVMDRCPKIEFPGLNLRRVG